MLSWLEFGFLKGAGARVSHLWEEWYRSQPMTKCRRCDMEFPNTDNGETEYCCRWCEMGLTELRDLK